MESTRHYAIRNGHTFYVVQSKEAAFQALRRGLTVTVVETTTEDPCTVPLNKIVGRIGNDYWIESDDQDIR